jgi:hypothetical protein
MKATRKTPLQNISNRRERPHGSKVQYFSELEISCTRTTAATGQTALDFRRFANRALDLPNNGGPNR